MLHIYEYRRQSTFYRIFLFASALFAAHMTASAATITVTNFNDNGPGSLRQAIADAGPGDTINFAVTGTIVLTSGQLLIDKNLTIRGPGSNLLSISANNFLRSFRISSDATVTLDGMTIKDGNARAFGDDGGGVYNSGTLTLTNATISGNRGRAGGGIINDPNGILILTNCIISGNYAEESGGILNNGSLTVNNGTLSGNTSETAGGSISNYFGTAVINGSFITGNSADIAGGGIMNASGTLTIDNSSISNNFSFQAAGIRNAGTLTITNSTVSGNYANTGGGIANNGSLNINNSTIFGNVAYGDDTGSGGNFGGILNESGTTVAGNSTIYGNESDGWYFHTKFGDHCGDGHGGGIGGDGQIVLQNTIVAGNRSWSYAGGCPGGSSFPEDIGAVIATASHNLISDAASSGGIQNGVNGNIVGADPLLGLLVNHGGPTHTNALIFGSPAINAGDNCILIANGCGYQHPALTTDQRGMPRNGTVDIGAFERQAVEFSYPTLFDFDGDLRSDISVFRPSDATWYLQRSRDGFGTAGWGLSTDKIVPGDYDGDLKTDIAVYRPSEGRWYVLRSSNGTLFAEDLGVADDVPLTGDFDTDGRADLSVYRPSTGGWFIRRSTDGATYIPQFGTSEDRPVVGDYNGDGRADVGVFRPSNGTWYWSSYLVDPSHHFNAVQFGLSTDIVTPADFDGDSRTDVAVYRPSTGVWYCLNSSNGAVVATQFGLPDDIPVAADFDGDTRADISVFRPSSGVWYGLNSGDGSFSAEQFGMNGDRPTPAAFRY